MQQQVLATVGFAALLCVAGCQKTAPVAARSPVPAATAPATVAAPTRACLTSASAASPRLIRAKAPGLQPGAWTHVMGFA